MNPYSPTLDLSPAEKAGKAILDGLGRILPAIPSLDCTEPAYPSSAVLLDVPGRCQVSTYTCGVTSTWSIITALGYRVPIKEWFWRCHRAGCHPDEGMDIDQIGKALKSLRLKVVTKRYRGRSQVAGLTIAIHEIGHNCGLDHHGYDEGVACVMTADTELDCLDRLDEGTHRFCRACSKVVERKLRHGRGTRQNTPAIGPPDHAPPRPA